MSTASRPSSSRSGFTLIEVVLAMGILVTGMTMLLGLYTFGAAMAKTAQLRASSAAAVEAVVADLESSFFPLEADGSVGLPEPVEERPVPTAPGVVYSASGQPNPENPREWRVDVRLSWTSSGVRREETFTTILLREVPFDERLRRRLLR